MDDEMSFFERCETKFLLFVGGWGGFGGGQGGVRVCVV